MNKVNSYSVKSLNSVNTELYQEGTVFIEESTDKVGVLAKGKVKQINGNSPSLSGYVKKKDLEIMIKDILKKEE